MRRRSGLRLLHQLISLGYNHLSVSTRRARFLLGDGSICDSLLAKIRAHAKVTVVGQLSNPSAPLSVVLEAASVARRRPAALQGPIAVELALRRLGNGVVQRAVVKVLVVALRPMRGLEVQIAVEDLLGHPVSEHSISSCLASGVRRKEPLFARVTRGRYVLASRSA
jgi:hypothetical protein